MAELYRRVQNIFEQEKLYNEFDLFSIEVNFYSDKRRNERFCKLLKRYWDGKMNINGKIQILLALAELKDVKKTKTYDEMIVDFS